MKFYQILATSKNEESDEQEVKTLNALQKQKIARKTDVFLDEYEDRACIFFVALDKETDVAVCVKDNAVDEKDVTKRFLEVFEIEYDELSVKEISMGTLLNGLRISFRNRLIGDDYKLAVMMGLETFLDSRNSFFNEKIADDKKTIEELKTDVEKYHLGDGYKEELHRILRGKKRDVFLGNPATYFIVSKEETARRVMIRNLVSALGKKGRLQSQRYTIVNLDDRECSLERLEELYDISQGATIYIRVDDDNFPDGEKNHGYLDVKKVCEIVKKKGAKTLTVFAMETISDKNRNKLENYMLGVPMLVFTDNTYKKEKAKNVLLSMAQDENFSISQDLLDKVEKTERSYTYGELTEVYNVWRAEYMGTDVFPEYKKYVTYVTEEEKQVSKSDAYKTLREMIGLTQAKKVIDGAINYFKLQQEYKLRGIEFNRPAMHMCFTGTPGTAKTTVARLVAEILKDNGVLSEGKLVEVGRSDLVGKFVGHTAPQVKEMFDKAKGSVLFIDEAYSLVEDKKGLYGTEAINAIVQEMESKVSNASEA